MIEELASHSAAYNSSSVSPDLTVQEGWAINANINAGQAGVQIFGSTGGISEGAGASITAGSLALDSQGGAITLDQANTISGANRAAGVLAALEGDGAAVEINNTAAGVAGLQVGTITLTGVAATGASNTRRQHHAPRHIGQQRFIDSVHQHREHRHARLAHHRLAGEHSARRVGTRRTGGISESGAGIAAGSLVAMANGGDITLDQTNSIPAASTRPAISPPKMRSPAAR